MSELGLLDIVKNPKKDIVDGPFGSNMKSSDYKGSGVPVIKLQNIKVNYFLEKNISFVTPKKASELARHSYQPGDIVITKLGDPLGVACIMPESFPKGLIVADLIRLRPDYSKVDPKFLCYQLNSPLIVNQFKELTKGTTRPRVNLTLVRQIKVWIPNIDEQRKVRDKIDFLFTNIDFGSELLKNAKEKFDIFKQSIFNSVICGKLVPQDQKEVPASILLKEIKAEKLALIRAGKIKKDKPLPLINPREVPFDLPKGWEWVRLGDVTNYGVTKKSDKCDIDHENMWVLELEDIEKISSKLIRRVTFRDREFLSAKNIFNKGDVLYGKLRPYLDKVLVADEDGVCSTEIIPINGYGLISSEYLRLYLKSPYFINYANCITHGVRMPRLGTENAREALFPLPPAEEQNRIVKRYYEINSIIEPLINNVQIKFIQISNLKKIILKNAFEGKLL